MFVEFFRYCDYYYSYYLRLIIVVLSVALLVCIILRLCFQNKYSLSNSAFIGSDFDFCLFLLIKIMRTVLTYYSCLITDDLFVCSALI
jgi:hypothetical protein